MKEVLLLLLNGYADWEGAFLAPSLNAGVNPSVAPRYIVKTVAPTAEPVKSIGGLRTLPDYTFDTMPEDYAALILIGGTQWQSEEAERVAPLVSKAIENGRIVGGICDAASFLAAHGFLNHVRHTGNGVEQLKLRGGANYTNEQGFVERQAVADGNIVTANGVAYLEFSRELQKLLRAATEEDIESSYQFYKQGFFPAD